MINADSTPVFDESLRLILVDVLGEENARRVLELVYELGEGGKESVMLAKPMIMAPAKQKTALGSGS